MEHSSSDISNHRDNTIINDIKPFTHINMNSTVSVVNEKFVSVQHFPQSKPSLTTPNPELASNFKKVKDESSFPPTISPLFSNSPTSSILSDYLSQKEMETLHSSVGSRSPLTVAETICKNPSILESVRNIIENGLEEKCKKLCSKANGSMGYRNLCPKSVLTNYGMNLFLSSHFWLKL